VRTQVTLQPALRVDDDMQQIGTACVGVHNLDPDLLVFFGEHQRTGHLLQSVLRVSVIEPDMPDCDVLPDVLGRYQILAAGVRFIPRFPFEPGIRYRASFDARPLAWAGHLNALTLEFSLPNPTGAEPTSVTGVFPSADVLPENLLRFYVCFSRPMQRGWAQEQISLIGPDGQPAPDVLYRPPLELWGRSMRCLTVLLDPGRLKRWVGPNRELGPPLRVGQRYALAIGSAMVDYAGRSLRQNFYKAFVVADAVRKPVALSHWKVVRPATETRQPLSIMFPRPLDWALLLRAITVVGNGGLPISGRVAIDQGERRWSFTPASPWAAGRHSIRVASDLEDVCGNSVLAAFDRPLRPGCDLTVDTASCSIPFELTDSVN
jgi:hypothetical protein